MSERKNPGVPFPLPDGQRRAESGLHAANCALNWMRCAELEEYPIELRTYWQGRGDQWLDAIRPFLQGSDIDNREAFVVTELIEAIEPLWVAWHRPPETADSSY